MDAIWEKIADGKLHETKPSGFIFTKPKWPLLYNLKVTRAISSEPVPFQVNPCNFKCIRAISK